MIRSIAACALLAVTLVANRGLAQSAVIPPTHELTPAQLAVLRYTQATFPRQLQAVRDDAALAERYVAFMQKRVNSYAPFRSFGQYGATYSADQRAQLELVAAQHQFACISRNEVDLWRERQAIVAAILLQHNAAEVR